MRAVVDCVPCSLYQAVRTARQSGAREEQIEQILRLAMERIQSLKWQIAPSEISTAAVKAVTEVLGDQDPYKERKRHYNQLALSMEPKLQTLVDQSADPLLTALLLAVAGNIIDLGILESFSVEETVQSVLERGFTHNDYDHFRRKLSGSKTILYIGDNAGEIVFDKFVLKCLRDKEVTFVVKSGPVINDACLEDANMVGIPELAEVITTGSDHLGAPPHECSPEFRQALATADLVIAKGQANFESVPPQENLYYLLTAKCPPVARALGVEERDVVLRWAGWDMPEGN